MTVHTIELEHVTLTRVGYLDLPVPAELLGVAADAVAAIPWAAPIWADGDQPRIGAAAWFADVGGRRIVYDPLLALDVVLRPDRETERTHQDAVARLFAEAGFPPESVDLVVASHIDGIGMVARRDDAGRWAPLFPEAQVLLSDVELGAFLNAARDGGEAADDAERQAWTALVDQGRVDTYAHGEAIVPGFVAEVSGGHGRGHAVMHVGLDRARPAVSLIGHLAVTAVHLATGECETLNEDPPAAWSLLQRTIADGRLLVGPLWPSPGYGRWVDDELHAGD